MQGPVHSEYVLHIKLIRANEKVGQVSTDLSWPCAVTGPVIVHIERDQSKHSNIEADVPTGVYSFPIVLVRRGHCELDEVPGLKITTHPAVQRRVYVTKSIPFVPFVRK